MNLNHKFQSIIEKLNSGKPKHLYIGGLSVFAHAGYLPRNINDLDLVCETRDIEEIISVLKENELEERKIPGEPTGTHLTYVYCPLNDTLQKLHLVADNLKICDETLQNIEFEYPLVESIRNPIIKRIGSFTGV